MQEFRENRFLLISRNRYLHLNADERETKANMKLNRRENMMSSEIAFHLLCSPHWLLHAHYQAWLVSTTWTTECFWCQHFNPLPTDCIFIWRDLFIVISTSLNSPLFCLSCRRRPLFWKNRPILKQAFVYNPFLFESISYYIFIKKEISDLLFLLSLQEELCKHNFWEATTSIKKNKTMSNVHASLC